MEAGGGWDKIIPLARSNTVSIQQAGLLLCGSLIINGFHPIPDPISPRNGLLTKRTVLLLWAAELRESFIKEGGVAQVLKVVGTKELKVQRALATCLANLAQEADAVKDVIGGDGLKKVLGWIAQGDEELTGSSVSILANASNNGQASSLATKCNSAH